MNIRSQLTSLRRIRRQCPFLCRDGAIGYVCSRGMGNIFRVRNRCSLACPDVLEQAAKLGLKVNIDNTKLAEI